MDNNWSHLSRNILNCKNCPAIVTDRNQAVKGVGNPKAKVLIIGLAPGRNGADLTGIPFTRDPSGILINQMLHSAGLSRDRDVFITNLVKCNPKDEFGRNRTPNFKEINNCQAYLEQEIELLKPNIIIPLGANATRAILGDNASGITELHGKPIYQDGRTIVPFLHPGYVIRGSYNRDEYIRDFSKIGNIYHRLLQQKAELSRLDIMLMILYKGNGASNIINGKTKLQKITFFVQDYLKKVGFNARYAFRPYHYGPYSREIYTDVAWLQSNDFINVTELYNERTGIISNYNITEKGMDKIKQLLVTDDYYKNIFNLVKRIVNEHINMNVAEIVDYAHKMYPDYDKTQLDSKKDIKITSLDAFFKK